MGFIIIIFWHNNYRDFDDKIVFPGCAIRRKPLDLDMVRHYLDKGCYKRLDIFQDHIFEVFERARGLTRTDSQVTAG